MPRYDKRSLLSRFTTRGINLPDVKAYELFGASSSFSGGRSCCGGGMGKARGVLSVLSHEFGKGIYFDISIKPFEPIWTDITYRY